MSTLEGRNWSGGDGEIDLERSFGYGKYTISLSKLTQDGLLQW